MSGLEGIAGLSFICNVLQLISFGHEIVSVLKHISSTGHPDSSLAQNGKSLELITSKLENQLQDKPKPLQSHDSQLLDIARECVKASKDLRMSVEGLSIPGGQKARKSAVFVSAFKAFRDKNKIQRHKKTLIRCQQNLQTYLAMHSRIKVDALEAQNHETFFHLSHDLQFFIRQCAAGNIALGHLITRESSDIKNHITEESSKAQSNVQQNLIQKMQELELTSTTERQYERLLASLKFPGMNERMNQIESHQPDTFPWIFNIHGDDSSSDFNTDETGRPLSMNDESSLLDEESYEHLERTGAFYSTYDESFTVETWRGFPEWLKSGEKLYWISGKPGSGKSTLMKYIASAPETEDALSDWHSDTRILMHFLWSPGGPMQRNIKGLLCSLLYQLYQGDKQLALQTMIRHPSLLSKDSATDWSLNELRESLFTLMQENSDYFCIFLDGLDEIDQKDGIHSLLKLLDELKILPRLKLCVSSRPEPAILKHLNNHPFLRIQDYTSRDIWIYADKMLRIPAAVEEDLMIVREIVAKAAGVFLWAVLVTKSLKRGLRNGDQWPEIRARLEYLPNDMMALYHSMWQKLGEDREWYSGTAALYFEIVLLSFGSGGDLFLAKNHDISVFELTASTDIDVQNSFIGKGEAMPVADLEERCSRTIQRLTVCCAGLLEVQKLEENSVFDSHDEKYDSLWTYTTRGVVFIHRTALDFLTNTEEGKEIRRSCSWEAALVALIKGCLIQCRLWNFVQILQGHVFSFGVDAHVFLEDASKLRLPAEYLVPVMAKWHQEGFLNGGQGHTSFAAIAAATGLINYVEEQIDAKAVDLVEPNLLILKGACSFSSLGDLLLSHYEWNKDFKSRHRLIRDLLRVYDAGLESMTADGRVPTVVEPVEPTTSAFICFLDSSLALADMANEELAQENDCFLSWSNETLETLRAFIIKGVDVKARFCINITSFSYPRGFYSFYWSQDTMGSIYLEVNIPFLVNRLLPRLHPEAGFLEDDSCSGDSEYVRVRMFSLGHLGKHDTADVCYAPGNMEDEAYLWDVVKPFALGLLKKNKEQALEARERFEQAVKLVLPHAFPTDRLAILRESFKHFVPFLGNEDFRDLYLTTMVEEKL